MPRPLRCLSLRSAGAVSGQGRILEELWREFFSDPSQWWDHRLEKESAKYPDFKHKKTQQALWLNRKYNPPWVETELAALAPGAVQSHSFAWNKRIARLVKDGQHEKGMELFRQMQQEGMKPDRFTFVPVLNACASLRRLDEGKSIHEQVIETSCVSDVYVASCLVDMYAKCGRIDEARRLFNEMPSRNVVAWNAMIHGHVKCGEGDKALELGGTLQQEGVEPDSITFVGLLNACASVGALEEGKRVHEQVIQRGLESDVFVGSSLIDMYTKCRSIDDACTVFKKMPTRNVVAWSSMIHGYAKCGQGHKALAIYQQMRQEGLQPEPFTLVGLLNACASIGALEEGKRVHSQIIRSGCESDVYVSSSLVDMYAKCGSIEDARKVLNKMATHSVVSWNAMIHGYVKCGQAHRALEVPEQMELEGVEPDLVTFVGLLKACAVLGVIEEGRCLHEQIIQMGYETDVFVGSSLVDMYAKCGRVEDAQRVFDKMPKRDVVSWNIIIMGYVKCGQGKKALELYQQMRREGVDPNTTTFVGLLNYCDNVAAIGEGRWIHDQIIRSGLESDVLVGSSLVGMYVKCGSIDEAKVVFMKMPSESVESWNAMILGHVKWGQALEALELYQHMQRQRVEPNHVTFVGVLNACAIGKLLGEGRKAHEQIVQRCYESDIFIGSNLVDMYAKCGSIEDAWRVFNQMPSHNVVSWNAMIQGFVKCGQGQRALELAQQMEKEELEPDPTTLVGLLNACASVGALKEGIQIHEQISQRGWESDVFLGSSLVDMYAKCGSIEDAQRVFNNMPTRNVVCWNAMIQGYVRCGQGKEALRLSQQMHQEGVEPDHASFVGLLNACASVRALDEGRRAHGQIIQRGWDSDAFLGSSLVDMYAKCGSIVDARKVFDNMSTRDVVSWNTMILGHVKCGQGQKALELFGWMCQEGVEPDPITFVGFLNACASVSALEEGRFAHEQILQRGYESYVFVSNSLIDMYAKCGSVEEALKVFKEMPSHDAISWTAMLGGYAMHGHSQDTLKHFESICQKGVQVNIVTFVALLSACSHAGLVEEGLHFFESMSSVYNISPTVEHHACIVGLLGRAGRLHEAEDLIKSMSCEPDVTVWMSLLGACRVNGQMDMGECIAKRIIELDPGNNSCHVLLSNIYAAAGNWDDVD